MVRAFRTRGVAREMPETVLKPIAPKRKQARSRQAAGARAPKPGNGAARTAKARPAIASALAPFETASYLDSVGPGRKPEKYDRGKIIFHQGNPADAVYYIQKGKVRISIVSIHGKEGVIAFLGPGDFIGEGCLSGQPLHIATATATTDTVVIRIEKQSMVRVLRQDQAFSHVFTTFLLSRSVQVEADLIDHLFNSSEKRLARILLLLANIGIEGSMETVPNISQDVLAARVGTTRSRINFFMNKFRKLGLIEYNGTLKIYSSLLNVIVHE